MGQIVSARVNKDGNYLIEVKPTKERISESQETVLIGGTVGWAERLPGLWHQTEDGEQVPLTAVVQIRRKNKKK